MDACPGLPLDRALVERPLGFGPPELALVADVARGAAALYGERLEGVVLVGSRARGTATAASDWDFLVFLDRCDTAVELPATRALAAELAARHRGADLSLSPLSREQFLGLDRKYAGIVAAFQRDAIAIPL